MPGRDGHPNYAHPMTQLQQAIIHAINVLAAITAIVVLQCTGNLSTTVAGIILAVTGFGAIGVTAVTPTAASGPPVAPTPVPAKTNPPGQ